ncbi:MAG: SusE domain-containing protein [Bacteroidales bacterium]|jgi:hypothetical protein|nr:SusE domain-containing protein [Bacteroidales bacterium]
MSKIVKFSMMACLATLLFACKDGKEGEKPYFSIETEFLTQSFGSEAGEKYVTVKTDQTFTATSSEAWCTTEVLGNRKTENLKIKVGAQDATGSRTAVVTVACQGFPAIDISITQNGAAVKGDPITISGPVEKIILLEANEAQTAATFTWTEGSIEHTSTDIVTYVFSMDIAGRNFSTATQGETITGFTRSFTVSELNSLILSQWQVTPGEEVSIEAQVVLTVRNDGFVDSETAVTQFTAVTFAYPPSPLYLAGSANPESNPVLLTEGIPPGSLYSWEGFLNVGIFKFLTDPDNDLPSLNKGADNNTLVERTEASQPDDCFEVTRAGLHAIAINKQQLQIQIERRFYHTSEHAYMVGLAVPTGWLLNDPPASCVLTWNDGLFVYEGTLSAPAGANSADWQDSFKIILSQDWGGYTLGPDQVNGPLVSGKILPRMGEADGDWKWKVRPEDVGNYRITVDMSSLWITFEKLP